MLTKKRSRQQAELELKLGKRSGLILRTQVTTGGLLAIGALVAGILLSTAAIVRATRKRQD